MKRVTRWAFGELNKGNSEALLRRCLPNVHHTFAGDHSLGGTRTSVDAMRRWFGRIQRLFGGLQFTIHEIAVSGPPWRTVVAAEWTDRATPLDGEPYENHGVHVLTFSWFRVASIHAYLDTAELEHTLQRLASWGLDEAAAEPILK